MPTQSSWPVGHPGNDEIRAAWEVAGAQGGLGLAARGAAGDAGSAARQTPTVSWCPRVRTQSGVRALPGTREWRLEAALQIRLQSRPSASREHRTPRSLWEVIDGCRRRPRRRPGCPHPAGEFQALFAEGLLLGQPVGVAAEVALQMRPAHLALVWIEMAVAVPAVRDHDPGISADERVELLAVAVLGDLQEHRVGGGRGPQRAPLTAGPPAG